VHVGGSSKETPSFLHIAKKLHDSGHKHLVMVAGSDRVDEYKEKLNKYNNKEGHYSFKSIKVVSAGSRDPDAEGVEGMSGTKMRAHARAGEMKHFKSGLPKALHPHAQEIANHIRSVKEGLEEELEEAVLNIAQRRKRAINLKRREPRIQRQKVLALKRFASEKALRRRSRNLARDLVRVRFAGKRGGSYRELSTSDKIAVDRQIQGKERLIKALAGRLYQRIRKREMARISRVRSGIKGPKGKQKVGMIASSYQPELKKELFESMFNSIICDRYSINEKQLLSLQIKSRESNLSLLSLLDEFKLAVNSHAEDDKLTPEQAAFNRINHLVAEAKKRGLWANIHAKRVRIKAGSGERMRKTGSKGAPSAQNFKDASETVKLDEIEEDAASHLRQATVLQQKGEYVRASIHRKIASALARGDRTTAKGYSHQLSNVKEDLRQWFKDRWVRMDTKGNIKGDCAREPGEGKPKCLPLAKASSMDKEDRASAVRRKRREDPIADRPGKGGAPVNVRTEAANRAQQAAIAIALIKAGKKKGKDPGPQEEFSIDETKSAPKGFHFTKDGKLKRGDADRDGDGGKMLRSDPLDKQRNKIPQVSEDVLNEKNAPTNPELWSRAKALAKSKFDVYPSAYANGWAAKWYKSKGGGWKSVSEADVDENFMDGKTLKIRAIWQDMASKVSLLPSLKKLDLLIQRRRERNNLPTGLLICTKERINVYLQAIHFRGRTSRKNRSA